MNSNQAIISVSQEEANTLFVSELEVGEQKEYRDLVHILESQFPGINSNQCSGIIHRAHTNKENGVLTKEKKFYSIRTTQSIQTIQNTTNGLIIVKGKIQDLIDEVNRIPISEFQTAEDFESFKNIQRTLQGLTE